MQHLLRSLPGLCLGAHVHPVSSPEENVAVFLAAWLEGKHRQLVTGTAGFAADLSVRAAPHFAGSPTDTVDPSRNRSCVG